MKRFDYLKMSLSKISDPKLVAQSFAEYFAKMRETLLNKTSQIFEAIDAPTSDHYQSGECISYEMADGQVVLLSLDDLLTKLNNKSIQGEDFDVVEGVRAISEGYSSVNVNVQDLIQSLQQETDSVLIGMHGFEALAYNSDAIGSATDFANLLSNYSVANNSNIAQASNSLYNIIRNGGAVSDKINSILSLFGIDQMSTQLDENNEIMPQLNGTNVSDYTGANPFSTIIDSIDFTPDPSLVWKVPVFLLKCFDKMWLASWKAIWGVTKTALNWIAKPIKTAIQVNANPQDCYTDKDEYGFFKQYTSIRYCDENSGSNNIISRLYNNMKSDKYVNTVFYSDFGVSAYHCQFRDSVVGFPGPVLDMNRYLRPINPSQFEAQLQIVMNREGISSLSGVYPNHVFDAIGELIQANNAWLPKDADEKDVFLGLIYSQYIDMMLSELFNIWSPILVNPNSDAVFNWLQDSVTNLSYTPAMMALSKVLAYRIEEAYQTFDNIIPNGVGDYESLSGGFGAALLTDFFQSGSTVTNYEFLQLLSCFPSNTGPRIQLQNFDENNATVYYSLGESPSKDCTSMFSMLIMKALCEDDLRGYPLQHDTSSSLIEDAPEEVKAPFMGYSRNNLNISLDASIKTDKQNFEAASKWWINFFIVAASVAAIAVGAVAFKKITKYKQKVRATIDSAYINYRNAVDSGDLMAINNSYKALVKSQKLGRLVGATTSIYNPSLNDILSSNVGLSSVIDTTKEIKAVIVK